MHAGNELRDRRVAASIQFQVGDRCQFRLEEGGGDIMEGEIVELNMSLGYHMVSHSIHGLACVIFILS